MKYYILDTDSIGFAMQHYPRMIQRMQSIPSGDQVVTTIITFGEDLGGWLPACRRAPTAAARAYEPGAEVLSTDGLPAV